MAADGSRGRDRRRPRETDRGGSRGRWRQIWPFGRRPPVEELDPSRPDLVVVAAGFDDAEASSAALERAGSGDPRWTPSEPVVLRHHLLLPADHVDDAVAVAAQDGYRPAAPAQPVGVSTPGDGAARAAEVPDARVLVLQRVQVLDALHCSQERSRMAGLAQRRNGAALGWEALQPPPDPTD